MNRTKPSFPKKWLVFHFFVILSLLLVTSCASQSADSSLQSNDTGKGKTRTYYIAADEVDWDYAPSYPIDPMMNMEFMDEPKVFLENGPDRIGHVYHKAIYREYTDDTFTTLKTIPAEWEHLGLMGPAIHAEVGDTIVVVFKNNVSFPASVHPHGVFYNKDSEGTPYEDGTTAKDKADDSVATGKTHTYTWQVPERAGPGPNDPSSVVWLYHSHTDEIRDTYSGLVGAMIITRKGMAKADGSPKDVDREFITMFQVFDENKSQFIDYNIKKFAGDPASVNVDDEDFGESNLMHSINGYVFMNLPGLNMKVGDHVRWYVVALGTEVDLHTPHWHGNTGLMEGHRVDVIEIMPASMKIVDMVPDNAGVWMYHCHVNDHIAAGMMASYTVTDK